MGSLGGDRFLMGATVLKGVKYPFISSKIAHYSACVTTIVVPWEGETGLSKSPGTRATSSGKHRTIYEPLEHPGICCIKEIW